MGKLNNNLISITDSSNLELVGNDLIYTTLDGTSLPPIDLSLYLDNTNLSRIVSGAVAGNNIVLTRDDTSTITIDISSILTAIANSVQTVTGNLVDNTDPQNPVVTATLSKVGTQIILDKGDGTQDIIELCPITTSLTAQVYTGGSYVNALADDEATLTDVIELSDGTQIHDGKVIWTGHGLVVGDWYYLSCDTAGSYTNVPHTLGWSQQLFFVLDANTILVDIEEGFEVGPAIQWLSEVNTTGGKNSLTKTSGSVSFNGQGVFGSIPANTDGSYFFTPTANGTTSIGFVGMSDTPLATVSFTDMTYAMFLDDPDLFIYSNGAFQGTSPVSFTLTDVLEMRRVGTLVTFWVNGVLAHSFTGITSTEELFFDTSLRSVGATLSDIDLTL